MTLFTKSLWPASVRAPYRRLALAMLLAPAILSLILSAITFILAEMSEQSGPAARLVALDSAITLTGSLFTYTMTFGLSGVFILWALSQRGPGAWAATGLVAGAVFGALAGEFFMDAGGRALVLFTSVTSVALFLLIRAIAGIQDDDSEA